MKKSIISITQRSKTSVHFLLLAIILISASCSTGIESTKKIKMTKEDKRMMVRSDEQIFSSEVKGTPLSHWEPGKRFLTMSDRSLYIFQPSGFTYNGDNNLPAGTILTYEGRESELTPGLSEECIVLFSDGKNTYRYSTGKPTETALSDIDSSRIPLLSDLDLIEQWHGKLSDKTLWTRNSLWYDVNGDRLPGRQFTEVKVEDVLPSTGDFPIKVKIKSNEGEEAYLQMNYTSDPHDSRDFSSIFYLSDPKKRYPGIKDETWRLIQQNKVANGMTKEECRLSLGNPDELDSGHTTFQTMDVWQYSNGGFLVFTDGILTRFRL